MAKSAKKDKSNAAAGPMKRRPKKTIVTVTDEDVARRAYELYLLRGCDGGHDIDDWLQAERELR